MQFQFEVGAAEKHQVEFYFNQFWGNLHIKVDGNKIIKKLIIFSFSLVRRYRFTVGEKEQHEVLIEKHRPLFMAGFRPSLYKVFVDGALALEKKGM
jgi:hypothetical protein